MIGDEWAVAVVERRQPSRTADETSGALSRHAIILTHEHTTHNTDSKVKRDDVGKVRRGIEERVGVDENVAV